LWLLGESDATRLNLRQEAQRRGVAAERVLFAERLSYERHLARLQHADLFLDTLPFNAGASASDALWAGVPVVTCPGEAFAARMAGSLLRAIGLPKLICDDLEQYEHRALELSRNPAQLQALKERLAKHRSGFPLFDTTRFCRHLERAYVEMHDRAQRGERPADFTVEPIAGDALGEA
jgi:predicted O-linked N-acetylglucosamine transferase (SPINDLY family)